MTRREFSLSKTEQNTNKNPPKQTQNPNPILLPSAEARIGAAAVTQPGTGQNAVLVMVGTGLRHWGCQVAILIVCICWCEFKIIPQAFKCVCNMNNFLYQICFAFKCRSIHLLPTLISLVPGNAVLYWAFSLFPMSWHFFFLDFIFCLTFTKCWNDLHVLAEALLVRAVMDHLFLEAINQPELTRIWGGAAVGGGVKVTWLGSATACCERFWLI